MILQQNNYDNSRYDKPTISLIELIILSQKLDNYCFHWTLSILRYRFVYLSLFNEWINHESPSLHHTKLQLTFAVGNNNVLHSHCCFSCTQLRAIKQHPLIFYQIRHTNESLSSVQMKPPHFQRFRIDLTHYIVL